jgi:hypothetical protein
MTLNAAELAGASLLVEGELTIDVFFELPLLHAATTTAAAAATATVLLNDGGTVRPPYVCACT